MTVLIFVFRCRRFGRTPLFFLGFYNSTNLFRLFYFLSFVFSTVYFIVYVIIFVKINEIIIDIDISLI